MPSVPKPNVALKSRSITLPGPESIHASSFATKDELVSLPPDKNVTTMYNVLQKGEELSDNGECFGERTGKCYTWIRYQEVLDTAGKIGSALVKLGVKPGEQSRIGICGLNCLEYVLAIYGCISFSITIVPLFHNYRKDVLCHIINDCDLSVIFCDTSDRMQLFLENSGDVPNLKHLILMRGSVAKDASSEIACHSMDDVLVIGEQNRQPLQLPAPENSYIICHTSGTTGAPKGIIITHANIVALLSGMLIHFERTGVTLGPSDVSISYLPLAHMVEHMIMALMLYSGAKTGFYAGNMQTFMNDVRVLQPTFFNTVPRILNKLYDDIKGDVEQSGIWKRWIFKRVLASKEKKMKKGQIPKSSFWDKVAFGKVQKRFGSRLRYMLTGGAPLATNVLGFSRAVYGCIIFEAYGQTEVTCAATITFPGDAVGGHVGAPFPSCHVKLVNVPETKHFAEGSGEVCFRGPTVMRGYFNLPEFTAETVDEDGWLHTGDVGRWMDNGELQIIDRIKATLKLSNAECVSPLKIEQIYAQCPFVSQVFVDGNSLESYLVALVYPNFRAIENWALKQQVQFSAPSDLCSNQQVLHYVLTEMRELGKANGLTSLEQVKQIHLHEIEFSTENELLTPLLKVRRVQVRRKFRDVIDKLYEDGPQC